VADPGWGKRDQRYAYCMEVERALTYGRGSLKFRGTTISGCLDNRLAVAQGGIHFASGTWCAWILPLFTGKWARPLDMDIIRSRQRAQPCSEGGRTSR